MLYGRDAERVRIRELLDAARRSRSGVLVVYGEAGVGKSALLEDARAQADDMLVLASRGIESEAHLPFAGVHQLVRPILRHVSRLPPPQAGALRVALGLKPGSGEAPYLVSLAVLSLLAEAAERRPVLCLIDDAHWLDDASADTLVFVARRLDAEGIVMLFAARESEVRRFDAPALPDLALDGLESRPARTLVDRHTGSALSPEIRERLIERTGGNPLALLELPQALNEAELAGTEPLPDPLPVSARVEQAFLARVRRLPQATQTLALVAAADDGGDLATVLRAARRLGASAEALDPAEQALLVQTRGGRLEFRHPLVRSAVYQNAPLSRRQAAHRALAAALHGEVQADRRTWHRAAARVEPDPALAEELERAAQRALARSGFAAASLAFERAAALTPDEHDRARRLIRAAENAWLGGRPARALMLFERARPLASQPIDRADVNRGRGVIELYLGAPADACELLARAATDVVAVDRERALYMLGTATMAAVYAGDDAAVIAIVRSVGQTGNDDSIVARYLAELLLGIGAHVGGAFARAAPHLRAALALVDEAAAAGAERFPALGILGGLGALFLGDDAAVHRLNLRVAAWARESGGLGLLLQALPRLAFGEIWAGRWPSASASLTEGLELARETGQQQIVAHLVCELALVAAYEADEERCRALVAESLELAAAHHLVHVANTARWALAELELAHGHADAALASARQITNSPVALYAALDRGEAATRAVDRTTARAWLATFESWTACSGAAWARAAALHWRALLCEDDEDAGRLFVAALGEHAQATRPHERARTELAYGELLRRARRRIEAREHLRAALEAFEALGAPAWAERARVELRASGQTMRRRDPSARDELTAQELQIAQFVATGLTNREVAAQLFLSPRTIDFHLRNVFRKLGIASRTELARLDLDAGREPANPAISPAPL